MTLYQPVGIFPRFLWVEQRLFQLQQAIDRYDAANWPVPIDWREEYADHVNYLRAFYAKKERTHD